MTKEEKRVRDIELLEKAYEEKWKHIPKGLEDKGGTDCALCEVYASDSCCNAKEQKCPIAEDTCRAQCRGTPYEKWMAHHREYHSECPTRVVHCQKCIDLACKERDYIKGLIAKLERQFEPFNFRIETREEADLIYHRLNCAAARSFQQYCREYEIENTNTLDLWNRFSKLHDPFKRK